MNYDTYGPIGHPTFSQQWICHFYPMLCLMPNYPTQHTGGTAEAPFDVNSGFRQVGNECQFNRDCRDYRWCRTIQDAWCGCVLGNCTVTGHVCLFGNCNPPKECRTYHDCKCKNNPNNCYCRKGKCDTKAWECHVTKDCKRMAKCSGRACKCKDSQCQWDCDTVADCKKSYCNKRVGRYCKCENHVCTSHKKPQECKLGRDGEAPDIEPCVARGLCSWEQPCDCWNPLGNRGYCTKPWFVMDHGNCRNDEDCSKHVMMCRRGDCICWNIKNKGGKRRGTCMEIAIGGEKSPATLD